MLVALIATIDAAVSGEWDLLGLLAMVDLGLLVLLGRAAGPRPELPLRADLVSWLEARGRMVGERPETLADRAVAAWRQAVDPERTEPTERAGSAERPGRP